MWSLLETRLRSEATGYTLALLTGIVVVIAVSLYGRAPIRSAEVVAALAAIFALWMSWVYQRYRNIVDQREHRLALHAALPLPLSHLATVRTLEPVVVPLAFGSVALFVTLAFRSLVSSPSPWASSLLFLMLALILFLEQIQLTWGELDHRVGGSRWGKLLVGGVPGLAGGLSGAFAGYYGARGLLDEFLPAFFEFLIAGPFTLAVFAGAVTLAVLNHRLFIGRRSFSR